MGLCLRCRFVKPIDTRTGSRFYYCRRSDDDGRFVRYPVLPVVECIGYEEAEDDARDRT